MDASRFEVQRLDHLGLVSGFCREIGLEELINQHMPKESHNSMISNGTLLIAMILNGLGFVSRTLHMYPEYFSEKPTERLLGKGILPSHINEDVMGRFLDSLYEQGVSGIRDDGCREILGVQIGDTESYATWEETFRWLKARGLTGVMYVISDQHAGLVEAAKKHFQGATWQRCQVHLMRNILGFCALRHRKAVADKAKLVLQAPDMTEARRRLNEFVEAFEGKVPKAVNCLEEAFEDAMAIMVLPDKYRKRLRTTNMQERLNEEIRRRERVIRIFPNDESALRLIGALLAEFNEQWQTRRYLDMDEFNDWLADKYSGKSNVLELNKLSN